MAREGGDRAPLARCWASSSAPIPVHFQSKLVDGRRKSLAALEAASSADQASSLGGYNPSQFALFGTLPRSITSPWGGITACPPASSAPSLSHCLAPWGCRCPAGGDQIRLSPGQGLFFLPLPC